MARLAVIVSGAWRGNDLCMRSLMNFVRSHDVTYFCVARREFLNTPSFESSMRSLHSAKMHLLVVEDSEIQKAEGEYCGYAQTTVNLWNEVRIASERIDLSSFDYVLKIRPDIFVAPGKLVIDPIPDDIVLIPTYMSFSGHNDQIVFGTTGGFKKYASIFYHLPDLFFSNSHGVPEMIVSCGLRRVGLTARPFLMDYTIYRDFLFYDLSYDDLSIVAATFIRRHGQFRADSLPSGMVDGPEIREHIRRNIAEELALQRLFPSFAREGYDTAGFYPPEIDPSDGTVFRFLCQHGALWRDVDVVNEISFTVWQSATFNPDSDLIMNIEGVPLTVRRVRHDQRGRWRCVARPEAPTPLNVYRAKINFYATRVVVSAEVVPGSQDRRPLSCTICEPFIVQ